MLMPEAGGVLGGGTIDDFEQVSWRVAYGNEDVESIEVAWAEDIRREMVP